MGVDSKRTAAWGAAGSFPDKYQSWKKGPGLGGRAHRGCLGFLIFGVVYIFVPLMIFLVIESAIITYALVLSLLWGVGAGVDGVTRRRSRQQP